MEYTVFIYGRRNKVERVSCSVQTKAESPQAAMVQVSGISSKAVQWYSDTYRQELGYLDDVTIYGYEVGI